MNWLLHPRTIGGILCRLLVVSLALWALVILGALALIRAAQTAF